MTFSKEVVQWLELHAFTAEGVGLILGQETKILQAVCPPPPAKKRASLVVQWLRILLPMQGTQVRALVREDPTCRGATKPVSHNY